MILTKAMKVGGAGELVLPAEVLSRLGVKEGDTVYLYQSPDGSYRLSANSPEFEHQLAVVEEVMKEDHDILAALAK
jgi:putative addiction module antidote